VHWFRLIDEARRLIAAWNDDYNISRPHMALGNLSPAKNAAGTNISMALIGTNFDLIPPIPSVSACSAICQLLPNHLASACLSALGLAPSHPAGQLRVYTMWTNLVGFNLNCLYEEGFGGAGTKKVGDG